MNLFRKKISPFTTLFFIFHFFCFSSILYGSFILENEQDKLVKLILHVRNPLILAGLNYIERLAVFSQHIGNNHKILKNNLNKISNLITYENGREYLPVAKNYRQKTTIFFFSASTLFYLLEKTKVGRFLNKNPFSATVLFFTEKYFLKKITFLTLQWNFPLTGINFNKYSNDTESIEYACIKYASKKDSYTNNGKNCSKEQQAQTILTNIYEERKKEYFKFFTIPFTTLKFEVQALKIVMSQSKKDFFIRLVPRMVKCNIVNYEERFTQKIIKRCNNNAIAKFLSSHQTFFGQMPSIFSSPFFMSKEKNIFGLGRIIENNPEWRFPPLAMLGWILKFIPKYGPLLSHNFINRLQQDDSLFSSKDQAIDRILPFFNKNIIQPALKILHLYKT